MTEIIMLYYFLLLNNIANNNPITRIPADAPSKMYFVDSSPAAVPLKPEKLVCPKLLLSDDERSDEPVFPDEGLVEPEFSVSFVSDWVSAELSASDVPLSEVPFSDESDLEGLSPPNCDESNPSGMLPPNCEGSKPSGILPFGIFPPNCEGSKPSCISPLGIPPPKPPGMPPPNPPWELLPFESVLLVSMATTPVELYAMLLAVIDAVSVLLVFSVS